MSKSIYFLCSATAFCLLTAGCFMDPNPTSSTEPPTPAAEKPQATAATEGAATPDDEYPQLTAEDLERLTPGELKRAPDKFRAKFETSKGDIVIEVTRKWSPNGADRFHELVSLGYYDGARFFRVLDDFMAQVGMHRDPRVHQKWMHANIPDDVVTESNAPGYVSFATSGPDSRSTQFFINYRHNGNLDRQGFSPFGKVVEGMDVALSLYSGYGEGAPRGRGPSQGKIIEGGNAYLKANFPKLDFIKKATIVEMPAAEAEEKAEPKADAEASESKEAEPEEKPEEPQAEESKAEEPTAEESKTE